jgi:hypothetical protein
MVVAPPPASGLRMQEVGDRLIVSFRPNRSGLVFLSILRSELSRFSQTKRYEAARVEASRRRGCRSTTTR